MNWPSWLPVLRQRLARHHDMLLYTGSNLAMQATALICQFVVLRFVPPGELGIWGRVALIEGYLLFSQLGIVNAMNREYPYLLGKRDTDGARRVAQTAQGYALGNGSLLAATFLVLSVVLGQGGPLWRFALRVGAGAVLLRQVGSYLEGTYRGRGKFRTLAMLHLVQPVVMVATLVLPWAYGFRGYCLRLLALAGASVILAFLFRPERAGPSLHARSFRLLLSTGWRLFLWNYLLRVSHSFPRLALDRLSGTLLLGFFTPVNWMFLALNGISGSVSSYLYPKLTYRLARDGLPVGRAALKAAMLSVLMLSPVVLVGLTLLPWLIRSALPKYAPAVLAAQVALVAGLLECMSIAAAAFAAAKAWRQMFQYVVFSLVLRFAGAFAGYALLEDRLVGVAVGMLASSAAMGLTTWITVRRVGTRGALRSERNSEQS